MSFFRWTFVALGLLAIIMGPKAWGVKGDISRIGDATHLEFVGLPEWRYDLNRSASGQISVMVPAFDEATELSLKSWSDGLIKNIDVKKEAPDGRYELIFTLSGKDVESFDYLTDEPSRLIIDFYRQTNQSAEAPKASAPASPQPAPKAPAVTRGKKVGDYVEMKRKGGAREPAGSELLEVFQAKEDEEGDDGRFPLRGVFDGGDAKYDRFRIKKYEIDEKAIIANKQNIYIKFPTLDMPVSELDKLMANLPEYVIRPKDTQENKEARLILHLYEKNRDGALVKTYNYFIERYPNSRYDEIVRNVVAEHYYKKYRSSKKIDDFQKAAAAYQYLLEKYPDSPLAERSQLLLGYGYLERGDALSTLQNFQKFLEKYPNSASQDKAKMALAQSFVRLNKFDDARKTLIDLAEKGSTEEAKVEASYRLGDVYAFEGQHAKAVESYKAAVQKYPKFESVYPNVHYNMGESLFWTPSYEESLENFVSFLERFPSHEYGGYAMTRIGELLEILGADRSKVMGAFLESYFRFKNSPGAQIARIRMLSQQMKGMKDKELRDALSEMQDVVKTSQMPRISEFVNLMVADGYHRRGDFEKSIQNLVSYYQQNPTSTDMEFFKKRILKNISESLVKKVEEGDYLEALKFNESFKDTWLRNQDRMDIPYYIGRAFEQAGVFSESEKIYNSTLDRLNKIEGTQEEKERRVSEHLPSKDELYLRLAGVSAAQKEYATSQAHLSKIKKYDDLKPEQKVQMVQLQAQVSEERGLLPLAEKALNELIKTWKERPEHLISPYLKLAELKRKTGDDLGAEKSADKVLQLADRSTPEQLRQAYRLKGDSQLAQGKELAAVETFSELLAKDKDAASLNSVRFKAGDILYARGDYQRAEEIWKGLDAASNPLFSKIAKEKIEHAKWRNEYKKYIERIPAMSGMKQE